MSGSPGSSNRLTNDGVMGLYALGTRDARRLLRGGSFEDLEGPDTVNRLQAECESDPELRDLAADLERMGRETRQAKLAGVCVRCHQPPTFQTLDGQREYQISGMCEPCFDEVTDPDA